MSDMYTNNAKIKHIIDDVDIYIWMLQQKSNAIVVTLLRRNHERRPVISIQIIHICIRPRKRSGGRGDGLVTQ